MNQTNYDSLHQFFFGKQIQLETTVMSAVDVFVLFRDWPEKKPVIIKRV